jgi:hypothetical protein
VDGHISSEERHGRSVHFAQRPDGSDHTCRRHDGIASFGSISWLRFLVRRSPVVFYYVVFAVVVVGWILLMSS